MVRPRSGGRVRFDGRRMRLAEVIEVLHADALADGVLTVGEILDIFGARAYGPLLMLPSVIAIFPLIGALPGVSIAMALVLLLSSLQLAVGLRHPWLPQALRRVSFERRHVEPVLKALEPWAARFDRLLRPRLEFLFQWPGIYVSGLLCVAVAVLALVGALAPALIVPPALVMILIAFAMVANDGFALVLAAALAAGIAYLVWHGARRIDWFALPFALG